MNNLQAVLEKGYEDAVVLEAIRKRCSSMEFTSMLNDLSLTVVEENLFLQFNTVDGDLCLTTRSLEDRGFINSFVVDSFEELAFFLSKTDK